MWICFEPVWLSLCNCYYWYVSSYFSDEVGEGKDCHFFIIRNLKYTKYNLLVLNLWFAIKLFYVHHFIMSVQIRVGTLYTVRLTHGQFDWIIKRKHKHFQELHRDLYKHKMMLQFMPLGRSVHRDVYPNRANQPLARGRPAIKIWVWTPQHIHRALRCIFEYSNFSHRFAKERQQLRAMSEEMPSLHGTERTRRTSSKMVATEAIGHKYRTYRFVLWTSQILQLLQIIKLLQQDFKMCSI